MRIIDLCNDHKNMDVLRNIEFYITPTGDVVISTNEGHQTYEPENKLFTRQMLERIEDRHPETYKALSKLYSNSRLNIPYHQYRIVHRFIRCNWGEFDKVFDVDNSGCFQFEQVKCPLRGECVYENVICNPPVNTVLSIRELAVMRLYCDGHSSMQIGENLGLHETTVVTHKRNALKKIGLHSLADFMVYAKKANLFHD